ncbi:methionine ABC transporter ATP-binding protein [Microbacterium sp.]|uniref:methionine ABC transporter ATP-binding protein n=1 Tax=Microbacterium sp. TaxID=51671 RepID=UPI003221D4AA
MIEIRNVRKSFGGHVVLDGIDLTIDKGDIFGLIGVSGAGKSTLLRCINRLEEVDSGEIVVDGIDVATLGKDDLLRFRRSIGMVFQQFSLLERKSVYDNVYFPLRCSGVKKAQADRRIKEMLELVGLEDKLRALPRELSGGQKQRVAIARALVSEPSILLSDEATSALDPNITENVLGLLRRINRELGLTIVVVTHEVSVMKAVCTRMGLLHRGELDALGTSEEFFLEHPELLADFTRDAGWRPHTEDGDALVRVVLRSEGESRLISDLAIRTGVAFDISWGGLDRYRDTVAGSFVLRVPRERLAAVAAALDERGAQWREL